MPEGFHPFPSRTRKLRPPGPMILGAQAPGKVGHRQVNKRKDYLLRGSLFCVSYETTRRGSTRSDPHCWSLRHESQCGESLVRLSYRQVTSEKTISHEVVFSVFSYETKGRGSTRSIHTAGVFVISRSVAINRAD